MDYTGWPRPPQNPNASVDSTHWHAAGYSAGSYHNFNADPYGLPSVYPHNAMYMPQQPQPPGVDPPYVPPPAAVPYVEQTVSYVPHESAAAPPSAYYPDPNASWAAPVILIGPASNIAGVAKPNSRIQNKRRITKKKGHKKTKVVQSAWCEVCKVDCNSKDVLDQHKMGKKHKKNLEKLKWSTNVQGHSIVAAPPAVVLTSEAAIAGSPTALASSRASVAALPAALATSQSIVALTPAATVTNQPFVATAPHSATVTSEAIVAAPPSATVTSEDTVATPPVATVASQAMVDALAAATATPAIMSAPQGVVTGSPLAVAPLPAATEALSTALPVSNSASIDKPVIGPEENPNKLKASHSKKARKKASACAEDLETKRRKVLEGGAAADSVRACSICNVVCNSDTVFKYHLAGQKHASMVKKQASQSGVVSAM